MISRSLYIYVMYNAIHNKIRARGTYFITTSLINCIYTHTKCTHTHVYTPLIGASIDRASSCSYRCADYYTILRHTAKIFIRFIHAIIMSAHRYVIASEEPQRLPKPQKLCDLDKLGLLTEFDRNNNRISTLGKNLKNLNLALP